MKKMTSPGLKRILSKMLASVLIVGILFQSPLYMQTAQAKTSISKKKATMYIGNTLKLKIKGSKKKVKWKSSKPDIVKVSSKGKVTALLYGTVTITAKVGKKKYKCRVTTKWPYIKEANKTIFVGDSYQVNLVGTRIRSAKSSNTKVATVTKSGKVQAVAPGRASIFIDAGRCELLCSITVEKKETSCSLDNHNWDAGIVTLQPTCVTVGKKLYTCTICGETKEENIPATDVHTPTEQWVILREPSLYVPGIRVQYCSVCGAEVLRENIAYSEISHETDWVYGEDGMSRTKTMYDGTVISEICKKDATGNATWGWYDDSASASMFTEINKMKAQLGSAYTWSEENVEAAKAEVWNYAVTGSSVAEVHMNTGGLPNVLDNRQYITLDWNANKEIAIACFVRDSMGANTQFTYGRQWKSYFGTYYASR